MIAQRATITGEALDKVGVRTESATNEGNIPMPLLDQVCGPAIRAALIIGRDDIVATGLRGRVDQDNRQVAPGDHRRDCLIAKRTHQEQSVERLCQKMAREIEGLIIGPNRASRIKQIEALLLRGGVESGHHP